MMKLVLVVFQPVQFEEFKGPLLKRKLKHWKTWASISFLNSVQKANQKVIKLLQKEDLDYASMIPCIKFVQILLEIMKVSTNREELPDTEYDCEDLYEGMISGQHEYSDENDEDESVVDRDDDDAEELKRVAVF